MESTRRLLIIVSWLFVALTSAALISKLFVSPSPPRPSDESSLVADYLSSPEFAALPNVAKRSYLSAVHKAHNIPEPEDPDSTQYPFDEAELSEEQREQLEMNFQSVRLSRFLDRIDIYYTLPEAERDPYMAQIVERFERRHYRYHDEMGDESPPAWRGPDLDQFRMRYGEMDPETEKRVARFVGEMRKYIRRQRKADNEPQDDAPEGS